MLCLGTLAARRQGSGAGVPGGPNPADGGDPPEHDPHRGPFRHPAQLHRRGYVPACQSLQGTVLLRWEVCAVIEGMFLSFT